MREDRAEYFVLRPEDILATEGEYVLLDAKRPVEYRLGHIPGAISLSLAHLILINGLLLDIPALQDIQSLLGDRGIRANMLVAVYDNMTRKHAARVAQPPL